MTSNLPTRPRAPQVGIGRLFLRFLGAHLLSLTSGLLLSLMSLPRWSWLLYRFWDKEAQGPVTWGWYLLVLAPFYVVLSTLAILVVYAMWTSTKATLRTWRSVLMVTAALHLIFLLCINLILGSRTLP